MSTNPTMEERLEAWLSEGPARAPDHVLDGVLASFPTAGARARSGPSPRLALRRRSLLAATATAAAAVVLVIGAWGLIPRQGVGPQSSPSPSGSMPSSRQPGSVSLDTTTWDAFTSGRFGLSFAYPPGGWYRHVSTAPWPIGTDPRATEAGSDSVESNGVDGSSFWAASQSVPRDVEELDWLSAYAQTGTRSMCYPPPEELERISIDGEAAYLIESGACGFFQAFAFVGGRVYVLTGQGFWDPNQGPPMKRELFDAFLTTVRFDPSSANDARAS
jgi:hypothetical protein